MKRVKTERKVTHLDEDQYLRRHEYCISIKALVGGSDSAAIQRLTDKGQLKPYCEHEEDGYCGATITPEKLAEVNQRLGTPSESDKATKTLSGTLKGIELGPHGISENLGPGKSIQQRRFESYSAPVKRGRGRPKGDKQPSFFCLKCEYRHKAPAVEFMTHAKFKRGRGRPKK